VGAFAGLPCFDALARQGEAEDAALAGGAFGPDAAVVAVDDFFADVQAEAHAAGAAGDWISSW